MLLMAEHSLTTVVLKSNCFKLNKACAPPKVVYTSSVVIIDHLDSSQLSELFKVGLLI